MDGLLHMPGRCFDHGLMVSARAAMLLACILFFAACGPDSGGSGDRHAAGEAEVAGAEAVEPDAHQEGVTAGAPPATPDSAANPPGTPLIQPRSVSRNAADLLFELEQLARDGGRIDGEQATRLLQALRLQGASALVPIRDYLLDTDNLDSAPSGLRQALLELLLSQRAPEVEDIALELLESQPPAAEVGLLGRYLERVQPGKHTALILSAAEQALADADPGVLLPPDFFLLLGEIGDEQTAMLLAGAPPHREIYAGFALAMIPDGTGLTLLDSSARQFLEGLDTVQGRLAIQLLAQQAPARPQAAADLLRLAEAGAIPSDLWPYVLDIVAGNWELSLDPDGEVIGSHTYNRPEGAQVIYRVVRIPEDADEGLQGERLYLLDRLEPFAPAELATGRS